jgi:hypothetical protein
MSGLACPGQRENSKLKFEVLGGGKPWEALNWGLGWVGLAEHLHGFSVLVQYVDCGCVDEWMFTVDCGLRVTCGLRCGLWALKNADRPERATAGGHAR